MKRSILVIFVVIAVLGAVPASAQIGNITNKIKNKVKTTEGQKGEAPPRGDAQTGTAADPGAAPRGTAVGSGKNSDFLFIGRNDMDGAPIAGIVACVAGSDQTLRPPMTKLFKTWINELSEVAALRSFNNGSCQVMAFAILDKPAYKYRNIDSLTETAQGHSIYKVETDKLILVKKIEAAQFFIVVVPDHDKPGLKLADLRMCGYPDTIKLFRRKVNSVSNCHDQKQKLYVFEKYKRYPGPMQTGSVIFDAQEFETLKNQGKFRGLVMYKLSGENLAPVR